MKKILAMTLAASLLLSSAVFAADTVAVKNAGVNAVAAATGTTTPAPAAPTSTVQGLTIGSKGAAVQELQANLIKLGYKMTADGAFGQVTAAAVKDFQGKNGLKATGIADTATVAKIKLAVTPAPVPTPAPAPAPAPTPAPAPVVVEPVKPAKPMGIYPDVVASASCNLTTEKELQASLGSKGTWITTLGSDVTLTNDLVWIGDIRKEGGTVPGRKLGLYYHSSPNIGGELLFTLKVPNLLVDAANATLAYGTLDGNVNVRANGFKLQNCTITGDLRFMTKEQYTTASFNDVVIKGNVYVENQVLSSKLKPQTITNFAKYNDSVTSSDMMKVAVTFKDGVAHDLLIDVLGAGYYMKPGILSSGGQGNWGKFAYSKAGQYGPMVKPSADRPADTIFSWDKQITTLITAVKAAKFDLSKFPTTAAEKLDFNLMLDGKYKAYTKDGAIDGTKLKGAERSAAVKVDAITSCSIGAGKFLKIADTIIKAGTK